MSNIFNTADILIPKDADMTRWACVACDQFTAEPEYWSEAEALVGDAPSTLRLMFPEAYLGKRDEAAEAEKINAAMDRYLSDGLFRVVEESFVYVERTLASGLVRRGLIGALDLEQYDWAEGTRTPIRATEGTLESRLPPRVKVRMGAALEMPHIMVFIEDEKNSLIPSAAGGETLYDFELMLGGGHIKGSRVHGEQAEAVSAALEALDSGDIKFAMGDGNHSLATAKRCWELIKPGLTEAERESHPARFALVELVNIHDGAVTFEPIHRVVFGTDAAGFLDSAREAFDQGGSGHELVIIAAGEELKLTVPNLTIGRLISKVDELCRAHTSKYGGETDYIHGDAEAREMSARPDAVGVLLPRMDKAEIFPSVSQTGPFPKKSFSIGVGRDKRYYLECRKIR